MSSTADPGTPIFPDYIDDWLDDNGQSFVEQGIADFEEFLLLHWRFEQFLDERVDDPTGEHLTQG